MAFQNAIGFFEALGAQPVTFTNYFLPSLYEFGLMRSELYQYSVGGFNTGLYWVSSEYSNLEGTKVNMLSGLFNGQSKSSSLHVRACRIFTTAAVYSIRSVGPWGGLIFHIINNGGISYSYYEAAPTDQSDSIWSNINSVEIGATAQGIAIGTGQANTLAIINQVGHTDSAAKLCNDLIV